MKNNKLFLPLTFILYCGYSFALTISPGEVISKPSFEKQQEDTKMTTQELTTSSVNNNIKINPSKVGKIVIFDRINNIAIIGKNNYSFSTTFNLYDGTPTKGMVVKFNTNEKNELIDMWVMKK